MRLIVSQMDEIEKRIKFKRLLNSRMTRAIQHIRLIGNLSDKRHYDYTDDQVKLVQKTLNEELNLTIDRFNLAGKRSANSYFNIDDYKNK